MIESFNEFLKKYSNPILEKKEIGEEYDFSKLDDLDMPDFVVDNKWMIKASGIVLRKLNQKLNREWFLYPYIIKANGKEAFMVDSDDIFLVMVKSGIEKDIVIYRENPLEVKSTKPFVTISTNRSNLGFIALINTAIGFVVDIDGTGINEAYSYNPDKEYHSGSKVAAMLNLFMGPFKAGSKSVRDSEKALPRPIAKEFIELYETMTDKQITEFFTDHPFDSSDPAEEKFVRIQRELYCDSDGNILTPTNIQNKVTKAIRLALCGCDAGLTPDLAESIKKLWFWGAATSGKLCLEERNKVWVVGETVDDVEEKIKQIDFDIEEQKQALQAMLRYVKTGGAEETIEDLNFYTGGNRCLVMSGRAGVGKSQTIQDAIDAENARENIDYYRVKGVSSEIALYQLMYRYNNMVLIFEEAEKLFSDPNIVTLMKTGLDPNTTRTIGTSSADAAKADSSEGEVRGWYSTTNLTRRDMYYKEIGAVTEYDRQKKFKEEFNKLKQNELAKETAALKRGDTYTQTSDDLLEKEANDIVDLWAEQQHKNNYPTSFDYNGFWVVTTNQTVNQLNNNAKFKAHWAALQSRSQVADITPPYKILWAWMKTKLKAAHDNPELTDDQRLIPNVAFPNVEDGDYENVIAFIDSLMEGKEDRGGKRYGRIEFRKLKSISKIIKVKNKNVSRKYWEERIKRFMYITNDAADED